MLVELDTGEELRMRYWFESVVEACVVAAMCLALVVGILLASAVALLFMVCALVLSPVWVPMALVFIWGLVKLEAARSTPTVTENE